MKRCPVDWKVTLPLASVTVNGATWQPAQSRVLTATFPCVAMTAVVSKPAGQYPAVPRSTPPCGACGPRELVACGSVRRLWHFMHRLLSGLGSSIAQRSCPS